MLRLHRHPTRRWLAHLAVDPRVPNSRAEQSGRHGVRGSHGARRIAIVSSHPNLTAARSDRRQLRPTFPIGNTVLRAQDIRTCYPNSTLNGS